MRIVPVLMSGGRGTRLWPLSRVALPKQFVSLVGEGTMIQQAARRASRIEGATAPIVVANGDHVDLILVQLSEIAVEPDVVIAEPVGRNTAPAVALAAHALQPDDVMVVLPSDAAIVDEAAFVEAITEAVPAAADGALVTFGVRPTRPETGYGYIEADGEGGVSDVVRFVEKPDEETATEYLESGRFLWNSGMFVFTASTYLTELRRHEPEIFDRTASAIESARSRGPRLDPGDEFGDSPAVSIDHAVMERTDRAVVVTLDAGWSDVGSWHSLWELEAEGPESNVVEGRAVLSDVTGSLIMGEGRLVAVVGLDDVVVIDTEDAVLVASRERAQDLKALVERLPPELR